MLRSISFGTVAAKSEARHQSDCGDLNVARAAAARPQPERADGTRAALVDELRVMAGQLESWPASRRP